ncbi:MAG: Gfo/Idh/MocA family oxidoreductase, partial [Candidatus Poribacteria bacterium]|nr:Gfo/Idh/MocA family oxidoreductase [Candidatus Poribacteria bacterium]
MANLKYALIGYGRRGKSHLSVAMALKGIFDIVGVCDADLQSAEEGAAVASTGRSIPVTAYTDLPKMIDQEKPDICDVVVPVDLHHVVSCYLSMRGIHHNVETGLA